MQVKLDAAKSLNQSYKTSEAEFKTKIRDLNRINKDQDKDIKNLNQRMLKILDQQKTMSNQLKDSKLLNKELNIQKDKNKNLNKELRSLNKLHQVIKFDKYNCNVLHEISDLKDNEIKNFKNDFCFDSILKK